MATGAIRLAVEEYFAARGIAVTGNGAARGCQRPQVGHHDLGLEILQIVGRHASPGYAVLDDFDQGVFRVGLAETTMTEVDAGYLVALGAVAENAVYAEEPAAFLNVSRSIAVLCRQQGGH